MQRCGGSSDDFGNGSAIGAVETTLRAVGLDSPIHPPAGEKPTTDDDMESWGTLATRCAIVSADSIRLIVSDDDCALASIVLGPAEAVALASDLLLASRARTGRPADLVAVANAMLAEVARRSYPEDADA